MVAEPVDTPVASPLMSTVTTPVFDELHEATVVMLPIALFENVAIAESCLVPATATVPVAGVIDTETGDGETDWVDSSVAQALKHAAKTRNRNILR